MNIYANALSSGFFSGLVAIFNTTCIEKFGGVIGGVIGTTPLTTLPASIGLYLADSDAYKESLMSIPCGMFLCSLFLYLWKLIPPYLPKKGFFSRKWVKILFMTLISVSFWLIGAFFITVLTIEGLVNVNYAGPIALVLIIIIGLGVTLLTPAPAPKGKETVPPLQVLCRGIIAGAVIGGSVLLSQLSPFIGGIASAFPSIFLTTVVSLWVAQGEKVCSGSTGPMMLGSSSVSAYALFAVFLFEEVGLFFGVILSFILAILTCSVPILFLLKWSNKEADKKYPRDIEANLSSDYDDDDEEIETENEEEMKFIDRREDEIYYPDDDGVELKEMPSLTEENEETEEPDEDVDLANDTIPLINAK